MPSEKEDPRIVFHEEEDEDDDEDSLDEDDIHKSQHEDDELEEEEEDLNSPSSSTSEDEEDDENPNPNPKPNFNSQTVTVAVPSPINGSVAVVASQPPPPSHPPVVPTETPSPKRHRSEEKKPSPSPAPDDSRRLFQRLWTDEDEILLLQGFLEYTTQRSQSNSSSSYHDTTPFYDQIKSRLQLDCNKNQLVEKLRRLKKKYRNVLNRISSSKDFCFKSPHDQITFEISRKIWSAASAVTFDDEDGNPQNGNLNSSDKKVSRSRRRSRKRTAAVLEDNVSNPPPPPPPPPPPHTSSSSPPSTVEDTVRSCLSPLFKELLYCAVNGPSNSGIMGGGMTFLNPLPLNFGANAGKLGNLEGVDERWRKQQILELEVYSKRLELMQEQIKSALEDLKSIDDLRNNFFNGMENAAGALGLLDSWNLQVKNKNLGSGNSGRDKSLSDLAHCLCMHED